MLDAVLKNLENTKSRMINTAHTDCVKLTNAYGEELNKNAAQKTKEYNDLCDRLNTAEKMCQERESVKADLQTINGNAAHLRETKGGLENVIR
jgi:hypothetical protein